jgi:hypothetical protein
MSTQVSSWFGALADVVEQLDSDGWAVHHVDVVAERRGSDPLAGTIEISTPFHNLPSMGGESTLELSSSSIDDQGLSLTFRSSICSEFTPAECGSDRRPSDQNPGVVPTETRFENGVLRVTLKIVNRGQSLTDARYGGATSRESDAPASDGGPSDLTDPEAVRDESVPPFEDSGYLRCLYNSCETFAEMSEKIDMEVSSETVRRYMIDANIHSPSASKIIG